MTVEGQTNSFKLSGGETIKLGRVKFTVREIQTSRDDENQTEDDSFEAKAIGHRADEMGVEVMLPRAESSIVGPHINRDRQRMSEWVPQVSRDVLPQDDEEDKEEFKSVGDGLTPNRVTGVPQSNRFRRTGAAAGVTGEDTHACMSLDNYPRLRDSLVFGTSNPELQDA